jgi:hypothetical protein
MIISLSLFQSFGNSNQHDQTIAIATIVIAVANVVYIVTAIMLWRATKDQVTITRRIFEESNRPRVGTTGAKRADLYSPELEIRFVVAYVNAGSVSAHDVKTSLDIAVDGVLWPEDVREEEVNQVLLSNIPRECVRVFQETTKVDSINNASTLSLIFRCTYKGTSDQGYACEEKYTFNKAQREFTVAKGIAT